MNKHLYRIVFNHALGLFQAVSELVRRPGRGASASDGIVAAAVRPVSLSLWIAFGWIGLASVATAGQIASDPNAPGNQRPTVMGSPNVAPVINITTPSKAGVSRNTYSDFNVDDTGAVLNNSRTNTTTQLAGSVAGNPWLATGTAKIILNEVTGPNPSALNGYIEVAGDRAQVIVANPAGISCDGCGVINANRFTLTTGTPMLTNGALDGYRVTGGTIQINGKGLDASRADYADIIARAVQVNGGIWAPQLQVTTGTNQVNVDQSQVTAIAASGEKPTLALDVSALGGMYANKIVLLGTENGVGARNAGTIGASAGDLVVTQDGRLENTGNLQSQANTQIAATGGVTNAGTISASRELDLTTPADIDNSNGNINAARIAVDAASLRNAGGTIAQTGSQGMTLNAGALSNRNGGRIGATEPATDDGGSTSTPSGGNDGSSTGGSNNSAGSSGGAPAGGTGTPTTPIAPLADGVLHISGLLDNDGGRINAAAGFDLASSTGLANDGGQLELRQLTLSGGDLSNRGGTLTIDGASTIHANQITNDSGTLSFAQAAAIDAQGLSNRSGTFTLADTAPMTLSVAGTLDNTGGTLATNAASFALNAGTLTNQGGVIEHAGTDGLSIRTDALDGAGGKILTAGAVSLAAGAVNHQNATLSATQVTLDATSLDNRGGIISASGAGANALQVTGAFDNSDGGTIQTNGDLALSAATFGNAHGTVQQSGTGTLSVHADTLNGAGGTLASNGALTLAGNAIDLSQASTVANTLAIDAGTLSTAGGSLQAAATDALNVRASGTWDNTGGTVVSNGALNIQAAALNNTQGTLSAAGTGTTQVTVTNAFTNSHGILAANGATTVQAGDLINQGGTLQAANAPLSVTASGLLDNSLQGLLASGGDLSLTATTLDNTQGVVQHTGQGNATIRAAALNGHGGTIVSNGTLTLTGSTTDLSGGTTQAQHISVDTGNLSTAGGSLVALSSDPLQLTASGIFDNTAGTVASNGALQLTAQSLINAGGTITAAGTGATMLNVAQRLDNTNGTLAAMGATTVQAGDLINQGGTLQVSGAALTVAANGLLDNSQHGVIASDGDLSLTAATLDNTQGTISQTGTSSASQQTGNGTLSIDAATLSGHGGTLVSNGTLTLTGDAIDLSGGTTQAQHISVDGGSLSTAGGSLIALSGDALHVALSGAFDNTAGTVATNGALQLTAQSLTNIGGTLTAAGSDATALNIAQRFDNTRGTLAAMGATTVQAGDLVNQGGTLQASGASLSVTVTGLLDNSQQGVIASDGDLSLTAATLDNTLGNIQHAGSGNAIIQAATLNGHGGTIVSNGTLTLTGSTTDLSGGTTQAQRISVDTGNLSTAGGNLVALSTDLLHLTARGAFDNSAGTIATNGALQLTAQSLSNANGTITAAGANATTVNVAQRFDNTHGTLAAMGGTTVQAGDLINQGGTLQATGAALSVTASGLLDNSQQGVIASDGDLSLSATTLDNTLGNIQHAGTGNTTIQAATLNGHGGTIVSNGTLTLTGTTTDLSGGTTQAQRISVDTGDLSTAGGHLLALSSSPLQLTVRNTFDNTAGSVVGNGAIALDAGALNNQGGTLVAAGSDASNLLVTGLLDNTDGTVSTAGATTLHAGAFDNTGGTLQAASNATLTLGVDGQLTNDSGSVQTNGALAVTASGLSNRGGTMQAQQAVTATVGNTLDNTAGSIIAAGDLNVQAQALLNRQTVGSNPTQTTGLYGQGVTLGAATLDNTQGQVQARDALTITGGTFTNAGGVLDGTGAVSVTGTSLNNSGGQLIQRGDSGALTVNLTQALGNTTGGIIGAEGTASIHAGSIDNSGGTVFARHDLTIASNGNLLNRNGGQLQTNGALTLTSLGTFDNSAGSIDATGAATVNAGSVSNVAGQILAGSTSNAAASLHVTTAGTLDNRGGTLGSRGGDVVVSTTGLNNSGGGTVVAQHDLNLDALGTLNNAGGTIYATNNLSFQNGNATLDNTGGQFGAGNTATLNLAAITNASGGHIQASTVWLTTPTLNNNGGEVDGTNVHATLSGLSGIGRIYGSQLLDAHITGDYTNLAGQRLESDGVLSLTVDGTLTNQGTLQTSGELDVTAANIINTNGAVINASADNGSAVAHITASGSIDNQTGGSLEGDTLTLQGHDVTNTGNITGNAIRIDAATLTNGADLGSATDNAAYQSGMIAAANSLAVYVSDSLLNRDATLFSQGDLLIAGNDSGARSGSVTNLSGDIEAGGNLSLSAQQFTNARRVIDTGTFTLSAAEQAANSQSSTSPMYLYDDSATAHQVPNIDPTQVVSAAEIAKAQSYCTGHETDSTRCVFFQSGNHNGAPSNYQGTSTDTLLSVTMITAASAQSRLQAGGDITLEGSVLNSASAIAAGRNLTINGQGGSASSDNVQNIAWVPTGLVQTTQADQVQSQYLIDSPRTWLLGDWWTYDSTSSTQSVVLAPGSVPGWITYATGETLASTITAGGSLTINGGDITNTVVGRNGNGATVTVGNIAGPGSHTTGQAHTAQAASAGPVDGAQAGAVQGAGDVNHAQGQAIDATGAINGAQGQSIQGGAGIGTTQGQTVHGGGNAAGATAQMVGTANAPLPGYVAPNNAMYAQHGDPSAPFLVTTAPRFAKGPVTSSDYLLSALGDAPDTTQKRLGDGYYEQSLVMDQILQLTGRKTLNGGDAMSQYTALMNDAADQASQLGLQLGAPLTSAQISSLSSDIVWLVDQVVDGQHVLVPVVYLSKATADALQNNGALIAGNDVNIQSSGTVRNDGTITGTQSTTISADTLINQGALNGGQQLAIATRGDTVNAGTLSGGVVSVQAGRDLINTGSITSAGDMALIAGRDLTTGVAPIQSGGNLAMVAGRDLIATASTITAVGNASLIAGNNLTLDATGRTTRTQSGQTVQENLTHSVTSISAGGNLALAAGNDLLSQGTQLKAGNQLGLAAGHDMTLNAVTDSQSVTSKTASGHTVTNTSTMDETLRGTTLSGANGVAATAGHDLTATAATFTSANGNIALGAGNDLTLNAGSETHTSTVDTKTTSGNWNSHSTTRTHDSVSDTDAVGTAISGNAVTLTAGRDLTAQAAQVQANGAIYVAAGNDVNLTDAHDVHSEEHDVSKTSSRTFNTNVLDPRFGNVDPDKRSSNSTQSITQSTSVGTLLSGDSVTVAAGHDLTGTNAQVVGTHDVVMAAGNNLTLNAGQNTYTETDTAGKSHTGVMNGGGLSVMAGKQSSKSTTTVNETSYTGSLVGSVDGSVTMSAGNNVHITGSDVLSQTGTTIVGKNVTIDAAVGTTDITQTQKQSSAGIHLGLTGGAATVANTVVGDAHGASHTTDKRVQALYAAQATQALFSPGAGNAMGLNGQTGAQAISQAAQGNTQGISLRIGLGASSATNTETTHDDTAYGSTIHSNGNVTIAATGGDLNVIGSQISGNNVALAAANNLNLLSQAEQHSDKSDSHNSSGEVGISIGQTTGIYLTVAAGQAQGHGNGTTHADTSVNASDTLSLISGGDTNIIGAQAKGNTVLGNIGGNLNIASEQDTNDYANHSVQAGLTLVYGWSTGGVGVSGSLAASQAKSNYASVNDVSGIGAGIGGFDIHVNGSTDLKGGVIASTADASKNLLDTGSLTFSDIQNKASYSSESISIGGGMGTSGGGINGGIGIPQHDSESSTTQAGIANGTIVTRNGNTDLSGLDRNPTLDNQALKTIFDAQKVQDNQQAGMLAGQVGMTATGDLATYMANHATTDAEKAAWSDGGTNKVLLHGLVGAATAALGGGDPLQGATGAAASEAASIAMQNYLIQQGLNPTDPLFNTLMQLGSTAIGGAVGGGAGASTALQGDQFNRQLHPSEISWINSHAKDFASQQCDCDPSADQINAATKQLAQQAARQTDVLWAAALPGDDSAARQYLAGAQGTFTNTLGNAQQLFTVEGNQFLQPMMYLPDASANRGFYQQYVQPGAGSVNTNLQVMLAQAGVNAYLNQGQTAWNAVTGAIAGIGGAILHPVDTFNAAGQGLGDSAAYALNSGMVNGQLQAVYGQDVSGATATLATLNSSLTLIGATGAGKGAAAVIEGAAKSAAVDAITAAVRAGWSGDAAGLEQFTRSIVGNVGTVNRFLSADAVNATMDTYNWSPAWQSGTMVADATLKPGTVVNMVVDKATYEALTTPGADTSRAFGGWATFDDVSNQAYARNQLAITSDMKADASYVIQVEVTKPIDVQIGVVGEQPGAAGGGNQLHFNLPPGQRAETFKFVGGEELH
ncbi:hemagglutinin repeat-containing protein [Dyella kyungheensis]|uniref:Hemagglutinin repeat-containing protein n=1 Tax=Dyella kyungheensis TaxID=1242174 RepID=A0ABS2JU04_9GAMM|nr:hemagglutinin repeat-containing protein [Dyella kyungheensis]MBM7122482.1 hemagglutinin repeat-containing protein [Dyella kyungheensis]